MSLQNNFTYSKAVEYLLDIPKFTKNKDNTNLRKILECMGNPDKDMKIIHVAGTNGKGSTCSFVNNILMAAGKTVGMFTSPHLVKINERIKINGQDISDDKFFRAFLDVKEMVDKIIKEGGEHPTFFEYIFLVGIRALSEAKVEYGIFEVGLGGRLDATNIFEEPLVSIITSVSMDHMEILGDTIEKIAMEKASIIKAEVPVVYYGEDKKVDRIIKKEVEKKKTIGFSIKNSDIKINSKTNKAIDFCFANSYDKYGCFEVPFVMEYQTRNAALAICATKLILKDLDEETIGKGLKNTVWSGRMELVSERTYIDGAHNYDGVLQFKEYVNELMHKENAKAYILFSVVKEKEYYEMMNLIEEIDNCKGFLVAPIMNARAAAVEDMAQYLRKSGKEVYTFATLGEAYDYGQKLIKDKDYLFCVGSLYMVGEIKAHLEVKYD
ncbi:MAG: bifunctional folylpolyglutamate synthase/dihydrofolate synthase [Lachnospiraceae bacterium]|nr:bifunctional folylpolyglutamate synthase/dihydrofolate synthase [Lachnospiraceae bacterium]